MSTYANTPPAVPSANFRAASAVLDRDARLPFGDEQVRRDGLLEACIRVPAGMPRSAGRGTVTTYVRK